MTWILLISGLVAWTVVGLVYMVKLRCFLEAKEGLLRQGLDASVVCLRSWQASYRDVGYREWRESMVVLDLCLERLTEAVSLRDSLADVKEMRQLVDQQKSLADDAQAAVPSETVRRASEVAGALERLDREVTEYSSAAADAAFVCGRFPLSLMAAAVGLRTRSTVP